MKVKWSTVTGQWKSADNKSLSDRLAMPPLKDRVSSVWAEHSSSESGRGSAK